MHKNIKVQLRVILAFIFYLFFVGLFTNDVVHCEELRKYPKIGQWKPSKDLQVYLEDNLFDHINGASELYLSYEFQQLDVVYYKNREKQEITVEIYTHTSPLFAYGIYSQERSPDANYLNIGAESYIDGSNLFILTGKHYLKIYSYDLGDDAKAVLTEFARSIVELLNSDNSLPPLLSAFPEQNLWPKSIQFIVKNLLGYSFFSKGYQAFYDFNEEQCRLFIIKSGSIKESNDLFEKYILHIHHTPRIPGSAEYKVVDPYHGAGIIRKCERYVYGGFGLSDIEQLSKLLDQVGANLCR
ncbi:hypothetical protein KJ656_16360 [bacterium]|nr:hypothetical protein [bacterium]